LAKPKKDLDQALDIPDALSEVRNMCKILAPFFASYEVKGDKKEIDFDESDDLQIYA